MPSTENRLPRGTAGVLTASAVLTASWLLSSAPALAASPPDAQAAPDRCTIEKLPLPGDAQAGRVSGSDPSGNVLLGSSVMGVGPLETAATTWQDGKPSSFDATGDAVDMNRDGVSVGHYLEDSTPHAWSYDGNEVRPLAGEAKAHAINDSGRIVGERMAPTPNGPPIAVPVTWPSASEQPVDLVAGKLGVGTAKDITEDGRIVGTFESSAVLWRPDGSREPLPLPKDVPPDAASEAVAINGPWVLGTVQISPRPVRWNLDTGAVEFVQGVDEVHAINANGWVVGEKAGRGVLSTGDKVVELDSLGDDYMTTTASISSDGTTIGGMTQVRGNPSPVTEVPARWTCS